MNTEDERAQSVRDSALIAATETFIQSLKALIAAEIDRITRSREPKGDCLTCKHAWKYHLPYGEYPNGCRVTVEQDGEKCHCPCKPS